MQREKYEMTTLSSNTFLTWLKGGDEHKPIFIILAAVLFFAVYFMPTPKSMEELVTTILCRLPKVWKNLSPQKIRSAIK